MGSNVLNLLHYLDDPRFILHGMGRTTQSMVHDNNKNDVQLIAHTRVEADTTLQTTFSSDAETLFLTNSSMALTVTFGAKSTCKYL